MKRQPVFTPLDISAPNIGGTLSSASHFLLTISPSGISQAPPPNDALKPLDGTIQTKKRLGYPNRFCLVSTKKHRSESERCLVRVAIQNFLKNPVISMVFGHPNRKISCISPHIRATVLRQPPFFTPKI